ncbi:hypothetical protein Cni_G16491 [Canna indica]|uniref:Uncharacterized protein n=1 Tax=Canna indica TaxID=4628 RepID=A0AAQ3KG56_9LILI|nr:hypothetical protein Cni_G16491 [Canna indica]
MTSLASLKKLSSSPPTAALAPPQHPAVLVWDPPLRLPSYISCLPKPPTRPLVDQIICLVFESCLTCAYRAKDGWERVGEGGERLLNPRARVEVALRRILKGGPCATNNHESVPQSVKRRRGEPQEGGAIVGPAWRGGDATEVILRLPAASGIGDGECGGERQSDRVRVVGVFG